MFGGDVSFRFLDMEGKVEGAVLSPPPSLGHGLNARQPLKEGLLPRTVFQRIENNQSP